MRNKNFLIFILVMVLLTASISQINIVADAFGSSSSSSEEFTERLKCILNDALNRSYWYKNSSVLFTPENLANKADELINAYYNFAKSWWEETFKVYSYPGYVKTFYDLIISEGVNEINDILTMPEFDSIILDSIVKTYEFAKMFKQFFLPWDIGWKIVKNFSDTYRNILEQAHSYKILLDCYEWYGIKRIDSILMDLSDISKKEAEIVNDILAGKAHPVDLSVKIENEYNEIKKAASNIEPLLFRGEFSDSEKKVFLSCLGTLAEFNAYLSALLNRFLPDFEISVDKSVMQVSTDGTASLLVILVSKNSFEGDVSLSIEWISGKPTWVSKSEFKPQVIVLKAQTCASSTLSIVVSDFAKSGDHTLRIVGKCSSAARAREATLRVGWLGSLKAEWSISPKLIEADQSVSIEIKAKFENGTLVPDAAVNAWVIKPDGKKSSVALNYHASMRKFIGEFWDTSLPGTYKFEAIIGKLFYAPYSITDSFKVQKFSYNLNVYAIEDYDYTLTGNLTYPYDLNEITSPRGVKYKVSVVAPFDDGILAQIWKNDEEIFYDFLCAGDFIFLDSNELLVYISGYYFYRVAKRAHLMLQLGTRTGRANVNPIDQTVEVGSSCDFTITISATDRRVIYVYGEPRQWTSFQGITWSTINDNAKLERKEFYSTTPLPSRITMRITPPSTVQPGAYNFWVSVMRSRTTSGGDGMNPGDLFLITLSVTPKQYKITLTSTGTRGEKNFGSIVFDGVTYPLYYGDVVIPKYSGRYAITMMTPQGYTFKSWNTSGQITVENPDAESTIITILGDCVLEAVISPNLGNITGRVIDFETRCGVKSQIFYWSTEEETWRLYGEVSTDDNGNFVIPNIPSCTYTVMVNAEGYLTYYSELEWPYWDIYGHSWKDVTVIPNSTVIVDFELMPIPKLIVEPDMLTVRQGGEGAFNLSIHFLEDPKWWTEMELGKMVIITYYIPYDQEFPEDLTISPEDIAIEPWDVIIDPENASNFSITFTINVSANASCKAYGIPITFCIYREVELLFTYVIVQVVPSNAQIQNIKIAEEDFDMVIETNSTEVSNFTFDKSLKAISFEVSGPEATTGYCNVMIPKMLMAPPFNVSVNGEQVNFNMTENSLFYFIYFTYSHSHITIQITSSGVLGDSEPPMIFSLTDLEELLTAEQNLTIYAFVMDFEHEIDRVWLIYSLDGGLTWSEPVDMMIELGHIYTAEITGLKEGDLVTYKIIAEDQAGNRAETMYNQVQVIPEFPTIIFLQLFMLAILLLLILLKRKGVKP